MMIYTIEDGMCVRGEINSQVEIWDQLGFFFFCCCFDTVFETTVIRATLFVLVRIPIN
jgi:hypothetical protein